MIEPYIGVHADPESVRSNKKKVRVVGTVAGLVMGLGLHSSSYTVDAAPTDAAQKSVFELECNEADSIAMRNQRGQEVVAVRLDCVPDNKASDRGAIVLHIANIDGLIPGTREADRTVLEASCRQTFERELHADFEGETDEWVRLVDSSSTSIVDNMPYIDSHPVEQYVNSAYVIGEKTLPDCGISA